MTSHDDMNLQLQAAVGVAYMAVQIAEIAEYEAYVEAQVVARAVARDSADEVARAHYDESVAALLGALMETASAIEAYIAACRALEESK